MRVLTWNINSIRLRLPLLKRLVKLREPDVVCLQETKVEDDAFPADACRAMGFEHLAFRGQKSYHGVAILSRVPFGGAIRNGWGGNDEARHVAVTLTDGLEVHSLYIPSGGDEPDPGTNPKFAHKLKFLDDVAGWFAAHPAPKAGAIVAGDFNVAPLEHDVWSHKQLLDVVSHTPVEVEKLGAFQRSRQWVDAIRHFVPADKKLYSWWSYRARDWAASDRGRRLDHIWVTPGLKAALSGATIERAARGWKQASDHVPVWIELAR